MHVGLNYSLSVELETDKTVSTAKSLLIKSINHFKVYQCTQNPKYLIYQGNEQNRLSCTDNKIILIIWKTFCL